jgi:hypothetical protein
MRLVYSCAESNLIEAKTENASKRFVLPLPKNTRQTFVAREALSNVTDESVSCFTLARFGDYLENVEMGLNTF